MRNILPALVSEILRGDYMAHLSRVLLLVKIDYIIFVFERCLANGACDGFW